MRIAAIIVLLVLTLPATAPAATVTVDENGGLTFVGAAGEANRVTATADDWWRIVDAGASVSAGAGCVQVDEHTVTCPLLGARFQLGDGDDVFVMIAVLPWAGLRVAGGEGADIITGDTAEGVALLGGPGPDRVSGGDGVDNQIWGGPGDDELTGGDSADGIHGGGGQDALHGGDGDDMLTDGDADASADGDVLDGGRGRDRISYRGRNQPLTIDLSHGRLDPDGDRLAGIEDVIGGSGDDVLLGSRHREVLSGYYGADRIACGAGTDVADTAGRDDLIERSCERVAWPYRGLASTVYPRGLTFTVYCLMNDLGTAACPDDRGTVQLVARGGRGAVLATGRLPAVRGGPSAPAPRRVKLRLTAAGRRAARTSRPIKVVVRIDYELEQPWLEWGIRMVLHR